MDADPQCNLTSYLIEDSVVDDLLDNSDGAAGKTLWSGVKPIVEATGDVIAVKPIETTVQRVYLVPGDIRVAEFEAELSLFWAECLQRKARGFRGTTAVSVLTGLAAKSIDADVVFFDIGPNIGPLNRAVLLDCDSFVVPAACDLFSVRALKTVAEAFSVIGSSSSRKTGGRTTLVQVMRRSSVG